MERKEFAIGILLLVLVGAILLAAVTPKLIDAEMRGLIAQAKSDLKEIAAALEAYETDHAVYPNDSEYGWPWIVTYSLTTPIKYIAPERFVKLIDPFGIRDEKKFPQRYWRAYRYINYAANGWAQGRAWKILPNNPPRPSSWLLKDNEWIQAVAKYGLWRLNSRGPDGNISFDLTRDLDGSVADTGPGPWAKWEVLCMVYDPTNGAISCGDIMCCQKTGEVTSVAAPE